MESFLEKFEVAYYMKLMTRFSKAGIKSVGQITKGNLLLSIKELIQSLYIYAFYQFLADIIIVFENKFGLLYG